MGGLQVWRYAGPMIIRGHEIDLTDAEFFFALPDGSVHASTRADMERWVDARDAEAYGLDLDSDDWDQFKDLPRMFADDLADLGNGLERLFELCSVAMGHGVKRNSRIEDTGIVQTNYVGLPLGPRDRFFADCLEVQFSTTTGEPAALFLHAPFLAEEFMQDAHRTRTASGAVPHDAISLILDNVDDLPLGQLLIDDLPVWIPKILALLEDDGTVRAQLIAPYRSLAQVIAFADMEGLL